MKGGSRWKGGDRLRNTDAWTYCEGDGAMLVQLSIVKNASGSVKGRASKKGIRYVDNGEANAWGLH